MKKRIKASYTIEAALLFPFILAVLVLLIFESFFIHDRTVINAASNLAALRGSRITDPGSDIAGIVRDMGERETDGRLLSTRDLSLDVQVSDSEVTVTCTGEFEIPAGILPVPGFDFGEREIRVIAKSKRRDPAEFIRTCRFLTGGRRNDGG